MATLTGKTIADTTGFRIKEVHSRSGNVSEDGKAATVLLDGGGVQTVAEGSRRIEAGDYVVDGDTHYTAGEVALLFTIS